MFKKLGNKISKILSVDAEDYSVSVKFQDGVVGSISLQSLFMKPRGLVCEILKGNMFDRCFVESGALAWPNGFELCPDSLRMMMVEQRRSRKSAA